MILSKKPLSLAEVKEYRKKSKSEEDKPIDIYLDKFCKTTKDKAEKIEEALTALNNPKIRAEQIVKIIDTMPEDAEDVNKVFNEMGLTEEEANAVLAIVK